MSGVEGRAASKAEWRRGPAEWRRGLRPEGRWRVETASTSMVAKQRGRSAARVEQPTSAGGGLEMATTGRVAAAG